MSGDAAAKDSKKEEPKKAEPDLQITEEDLFEDFPVDAGKAFC